MAPGALGLEIRQLRYLVALAEERSMTRAAQRLHMSQPALSQAIRTLEPGFGTQVTAADLLP